MRRKHYHVLVGLKGCYMPDVSEVYTNKRQAFKAAKRHKDNWNESLYSDFFRQARMKGGNGYYESRHHIISVDSCTDANCLIEGEK